MGTSMGGGTGGTGAIGVGGSMGGVAGGTGATGVGGSMGGITGGTGGTFLTTYSLLLLPLLVTCISYFNLL